MEASSYLKKLRDQIKNPKTCAYRVIKIIDDRRIKALQDCRLYDHHFIKKQVNLIKLIVQRNPFFYKNMEDLVEIVDVCGYQEFHGNPVIGVVLEFVFNCMERLNDKVRLELYSIILSSPECAAHYLSTCNMTRLCVGTTRFCDFVLGWLVSHVSNTDSLTKLRRRLLRYMDHQTLRELLSRGTEDLTEPERFRFPGNKYFRLEKGQYVCVHLLVDLLVLVLASLFFHMERRNLTSDYAGDRDELLKCAEVIVRAMPKVSSSLIFKRGSALMKYIQSYRPKEIMRGVFAWIEANSYLPGFRERISPGVLSLKQLARCSVRKTLYLNWALPDAIGELELPTELEEYLELLED